MEILAESKKLNKIFSFEATVNQTGWVSSRYKVELVMHPVAKKEILCVVVPASEINILWGVEIPGDTVTIPLQDEKKWISLQEQAEKIVDDRLNAKTLKENLASQKRRLPFFKKAAATGERQLISRVHAEWNSYRDQGSDDYILTYANPDGSITVDEEKAEPDHY